jgi:4-amino-4-deoxy-L-arabinose transferase-like glycosyltransferase
MNTSPGLLQRPAPAREGGRARFLRGPAPAASSWLAANWQRVALPTLLLVTAVAYLWDLSASGNANTFYAAAVQAGTKSWKAFFFGSLDSSNFITVDKPPASLWVMALSGRIFGFSSWSMLAPQALEGVAAVALLYASVKRWFGAGAGLAAGALLAATPVAALMFRFNNPDALLVLLLVAAAYCLTRALERAGTRWVVAAGTMIGFAFLAKMMQAFLVLPAFVLVYLVAAPTGLRRRMLQTLAGGVAIILSAGWWVAIVALWPASSRPMIDGSSDNSILNLITGYNGLGRIFGGGGPGGGGGGGGAGANFSGATGVLRLFNSVMGGQASWLLPAALLALGAGLVATRRAPRTDRTRAALLLWGGWLIVSALVFSLSSGIIHTYYTVALAPAIAALVAIGGRMLWTRRESTWARVVAAVGVAVSAGWSWALLDRTPNWEPWLRTAILVAGAVAVVGLVVSALWRPLRVRLAVTAVVVGAMASVAGPVAYAAQTITTPHTGSVPSAGPASAGGLGGGFGAGGRPGGFSASAGGRPGGSGFGGGTAPGGFRLGGAPSGGASSGGAPTGAGGAATGAGTGGSASRSAGTGGMPGGQTTVSAALTRALKADAGSYRWVAATSGSQSAASLELATGGEPVMAIGGFSGEGGNLTLAQFESYVKAGDIHYYLASGGGGGSSSSSSGSGSGGGVGGGGLRGGSSNAITTWVEAHYKSVTIGGQTLYDLTQPRS